MWSKIRNWLIGIGGAVIAGLLAILGLKNRKIKKIEVELDETKEDLEEQKQIRKTEQKLQEVAIEASAETNKEIYDVKEETAQKLSESAEKEPSGKTYNELIKEWNDEKQK